VKIVVLLMLLSLVVLLSSCDRDASMPRIPGPDFKADILVGKDLFSVNCALCHGVSLTGTDNGPSLLNQVYRPNRHGDLAFYMAVSSGVKKHHWSFGDMPPVPGLTGEDVANIIAYVRQEQLKSGIK